MLFFIAKVLIIFVFPSSEVDMSKTAELAQLVERTTLNRVVEGSIPSFGAFCNTRDGEHDFFAKAKQRSPERRLKK